MKRKLRIVNYAVNGVGTGHVTRLIAVNRWLRRHAAQLDLPLEIYFLTSSEAGGLLFAEKFPAFKLPSKTIAEEAALDNTFFLETARQWVSHTLDLLRPDLLVVDTFPGGYFEELETALRLCDKKAFIYRPLKESHARQPQFQRALSNYDAILVPEYARDASLPVSELLVDRVQYLGPIMVREHDEALNRDEARQQLCIADDALAVYLSAGGGGDTNAATQLHHMYEALRDVAGLHVIIGAGPLYRGRPIYGERLTWLSHICSAELMNAFDLAISAAGYNSFNELMHFGVPTIFVPQEKWADDQQARAARAERVGAAMIIDPQADAAAFRRTIEQWRDPARQAKARLAARELVPSNHAREAAQVLLKLLDATQ